MATSPTSGPGSSGGGGLTAVYAAYHGSNANIANGAQGALPWSNRDDGTELFDRTTPESPAALAAGVYIVTVNVLATALTAAGSYQVSLGLDTIGVGIEVDADTGTSVNGNGIPTLTVSCAYYIPLNGLVEVKVTNFDGAAARNFRIAEATVIKLA